MMTEERKARIIERWRKLLCPMCPRAYCRSTDKEVSNCIKEETTKLDYRKGEARNGQ